MEIKDEIHRLRNIIIEMLQLLHIRGIIDARKHKYFIERLWEVDSGTTRKNNRKK